jgi:hypothetical protein
MQDLLQRLSHVELDQTAGTVLSFLDSVDPCFLGLIVAVLVFIGSRMVAGQPSVQGWGLRLAVATFLIYGGYLWFSGKPDEGIPLWKLALRCGCVAGIVLALSWIVLPVLSFVHRRLRLALAVFIGYGIYAAVTAGEFTSEQWPIFALEALAATGLALIVAWIVDPFWTAFTRHLLPRRASAQEDAAPEELPMPTRKSPARATMLMPAPAVQVIDSPSVAGSEAQRRRDKARMQLELAYLQATPALTNWMPRPMFDDFLRRHLGDHLPPQDVEDNARQLLLVLRQHQEQVQERADFTSFEDLSSWLLTEQQRIQALALDQQIKQSQLLDLHQRYLVLATKMVQKQTLLSCQ